MSIGSKDMEILTDVLCGKLSESDGRFQKWLMIPENMALYRVLSGQAEPEDSSFEKEEVYKEIATILNFRSSRLGRRSVFKAGPKLMIGSLFVLAVGITLWISSPKKASGDRVRFQSGEKIAYLNTASGDIIPLGESFIRKGENGVLVSNRKEDGTLFFELIAQPFRIGHVKAERQILSVPRGGEYSVVLCDGTKVHLNSDTQLLFPDRFADGTRTVGLTGEAFFEVEAAEMPFIVELNGMDIEVKGTRFNINTRSPDSCVKTTLVEGVVDGRIHESGVSIRLKPSEQLSFNPSSGETRVTEVDTDIYTSWKDGVFVFRNQMLGEIFDQLSRWYNFKIEYKRPEIATMHFSGSAEKNKELDVLLNQIQMVTDIRYKKVENKIVLY